MWNGFLQDLSASTEGYTGKRCDWDERFDDLGGCWIHTGLPPEPGTPCYVSTQCIYSRLFSFINDAVKRPPSPEKILPARAALGRPRAARGRGIRRIATCAGGRPAAARARRWRGGGP